ncbi:ankyrin repeat protein [Oesophagostomum dentatum]|uniref:Ankyrin repeat protein n=1 Tax=Oesophagostomum dentatum TaxID=61180 RepID=A0A0B1TDJ3_OESDE|nr:ankyrin repeat protein [Oesophagostomum dentatum]
MGVIAVIVRVRRKRKRVMFAPCWKIPECAVDGKGGLENSLYRPPTPPDTNSPEYDSCDDEDKKDNGTHLESVVDGDSPLLLAVRRGDYEEVERMISSADDFIDVVRSLFRWELHIPLIIFCLFYVDSNGLGILHHAVANNDAKMLKMLIECGQVDIFQRNSLGQSPLVFAARLAHADLDCISILVKAIDDFRKRRRDDLLLENFEDIEANRYFRWAFCLIAFLLIRLIRKSCQFCSFLLFCSAKCGRHC